MLTTPVDINCLARTTIAAIGILLAGTAVADPPRRALPPVWDQDTLDVFFSDARDVLEGSRPRYATRDSKAPVAGVGTADTPAEDPPAGQALWSHIIDADAIETEIKMLAQRVSRDVTSAGPFKGGGYQQCRNHFSLLAVLFAVAAEYDGDVRWKDRAAGLRDLFARAGVNCQTGTDQTFREAAQRRDDLAELIRGGRPHTPPGEQTGDWHRVTDRPPLMRRMQEAHQDRLAKWLAGGRQFRRHRDEVLHEAQMLAMMAEIIQREGFEYWDDDTYAGYAAQLASAARDMKSAAAQRNYEQARQAFARATKACSHCHEGYRG